MWPLCSTENCTIIILQCKTRLGVNVRLIRFRVNSEILPTSFPAEILIDMNTCRHFVTFTAILPFEKWTRHLPSRSSSLCFFTLTGGWKCEHVKDRLHRCGKRVFFRQTVCSEWSRITESRWGTTGRREGGREGGRMTAAALGWMDANRLPFRSEDKYRKRVIMYRVVYED